MESGDRKIRRTSLQATLEVSVVQKLMLRPYRRVALQVCRDTLEGERGRQTLLAYELAHCIYISTLADGRVLNFELS